jgi:hypothetical protein
LHGRGIADGIDGEDATLGSIVSNLGTVEVLEEGRFALGQVSVERASESRIRRAGWNCESASRFQQ